MLLSIGVLLLFSVYRYSISLSFSKSLVATSASFSSCIQLFIWNPDKMGYVIFHMLTPSGKDYPGDAFPADSQLLLLRIFHKHTGNLSHVLMRCRLIIKHDCRTALIKLYDFAFLNTQKFSSFLIQTKAKIKRMFKIHHGIQLCRTGHKRKISIFQPSYKLFLNLLIRYQFMVFFDNSDGTRLAVFPESSPVWHFEPAACS